MSRQARDWMGLPAPHRASSHHGRPIAAVARCLAFLTAFVLLGACGFTPQGDAVRSAVFSSIQKAGEAGLENAEKFMCELAPVGAVKRRYGSADVAAAYAKLCERGAAGNIIAPRMVEPSERLSFPSSFPEGLRQ